MKAEKYLKWSGLDVDERTEMREKTLDYIVIELGLGGSITPRSRKLWVTSMQVSLPHPLKPWTPTNMRQPGGRLFVLAAVVSEIQALSPPLLPPDGILVWWLLLHQGDR